MTAPAGTQPELADPDGYAPEFEVVVEGLTLDPATKNDILDVKVHRDIDEMSGFDLELNNWDDVALKFKYSDSKDLRIGAHVSVRLGYADRLLTVATGKISTLAPKFPDSASPTISITCVDGLLDLKDRKPTKAEDKNFVNKTDWEIAEQIARRNHLAFETTHEGPRHDLVVQKNQSDAQFLVERAKRIDFDCYLLPDPHTGVQTLYFIKPTDGRDSRPIRLFRLAYAPGLASGPSGQPPGLVPNLLDFTPTMTLSDQVSKLTVHGWDPVKAEPIEYVATKDDLPGGQNSADGQSGPEAASAAAGDRQEVVVDAPVLSQEEAKELAISLLRERAYEFITATGRVAGLPELRPGDNLEIFGLGTRFSGTYFVKRVEHALNSSGFFTTFTGRRIFQGDKQ
ncbi:phage late control D family protein [Amycolatopsis sp. SID8362]|uniref:phage late control D family protein n=1 Tax=Amycolatopsis sp. SID8362 TaxID=2690346 RepID=UPI00136F1C4E|nr:phage late control D family protein [Amycolatopsis sp. SID8362]NBH08772.1 type IV secretion protein Rhs [Amycolatopsis sp. SID8362]NED45465.1 phage late control D family protein [Amycolatopsis sp. SID8362]